MCAQVGCLLVARDMEDQDPLLRDAVIVVTHHATGAASTLQNTVRGCCSGSGAQVCGMDFSHSYVGVAEQCPAQLLAAVDQVSSLAASSCCRCSPWSADLE